MKNLLLMLVSILFTYHLCTAQDINTLMKAYDTTNRTDNKIVLFSKYLSASENTADENIIQLLKLSNGFKVKKDLQGEGVVNASIGNQYITKGDFINSLKHYFASLKNFEEVKDSPGIMYSLFAIGNAYIYAENFEQALIYMRKSIVLAKKMVAFHMLII